MSEIVIVNVGEINEFLQRVKGLQRLGDYAQADVLLTERIERARMAPPFLENMMNLFNLDRLLNERGLVRRMLGRYDEAMRDYDIVLEFTPKREQRTLALINRADVYRVGRSDFASAHVSLDEALTYAKNGTLLHAKAVDQRGLVFAGQKDNVSAIACYQRARGICEKLTEREPSNEDSQNRLGQVILHLGTAYVALNDPNRVEEAYTALISSLDIFRKQKDHNGILNAVMVIGRIAAIKKEYDAALAAYDQAMKHLDPEQDKRGVACLSLHMAQAYMEQGKFVEAMPCLRIVIDGVSEGYITKHDRGVMKDTWNRIKALSEGRMELHFGAQDGEVLRRFDEA